MTESSSAEKLITLEYGYIQQTITEAIQDRYQLLNFYIAIATGAASICVGLFAIESLDRQAASMGVALISFLMWLVGIIFFLMIVRLRQAWAESIQTLQLLKNYFLTQHPDLQQAIAWQADTMPRRNKFGNIHQLIALLISVISSVFVWLIVFAVGRDTAAAVVGFILATLNLVTCTSLYYLMLK